MRFAEHGFLISLLLGGIQGFESKTVPVSVTGVVTGQKLVTGGEEVGVLQGVAVTVVQTKSCSLISQLVFALQPLALAG